MSGIGTTGKLEGEVWLLNCQASGPLALVEPVFYHVQQIQDNGGAKRRRYICTLQMKTQVEKHHTLLQHFTMVGSSCEKRSASS
jgi:hypothetical protein